jgi:hypothetical protein
MIDPTEELKTRAEILHKRIVAGDAAARARLRALAEYKRADDATILRASRDVQRKHCLTVVGREAGFASWEHALRVLRGDRDEADFGTMLYDDATGATLNAWYADYETARAHLVQGRERGEPLYLLAYKRQFFVTDRYFVEVLGLDPQDPDWTAIGFDWVRPLDVGARTRLYAKRLHAQRWGFRTRE